MTDLVIMNSVMEKHPVNEILDRWPSRKDVLADARLANPKIEIVAIHRWFARHSIPSGYWAALIAGAKARKIKVGEGELSSAHAINNEQDGHCTNLNQGACQ